MFRASWLYTQEKKYEQKRHWQDKPVNFQLKYFQWHALYSKFKNFILLDWKIYTKIFSTLCKHIIDFCTPVLKTLQIQKLWKHMLGAF